MSNYAVTLLGAVLVLPKLVQEGDTSNHRVYVEYYFPEVVLYFWSVLQLSSF